MLKIGILLGTRPEAIKLIPVYKALHEHPSYEVTLISTGQHREMLQQIFAFFDVQADVELNVMTENQTLEGLTATLIQSVSTVLKERPQDAIIVQGDTTTCMVGALAGYYQKIKVVHVEAGLRTYDKYSPFPEEVNRKLTGSIADIHFAPTQRAVNSLHDENITKGVYMVGNTVIDALLLALEKVNTQEIHYHELFAEIYDSSKPMVLVTGHRRESFGDGFQNICDALIELSSKYPNHQFIYPVHLNPNVQKVVQQRLGQTNNIRLIAPLPYDQLVYLMSKSKVVLTDSGGIQEEAPSLNKPVLVMRDTTERPEGIEAGCCKLCGTDKDTIVRLFSEIVEDESVYAAMTNAKNPYGNGDTSTQIANILREVI